MPSYIIIGASRGIGYAFLQHLSANPSNTIIATVRRPADTIAQLKADNISNVTVIAADLLSRQSVENAASESSKLLDGKVDYLILNGAYYDTANTSRFLDDYTSDPDVLDADMDLGWRTNVVGAMYVLNAFLPLVRAGPTKKVMVVSTGMADLELAKDFEVWEAAPYSINKAALNMLVVKYAARYGRKEGILFLAMSPGMVDVGKEMPGESELPSKFMKYAPTFKGPITPAKSVEGQLSVLEKASVERDSGRFVSHLGTGRWLEE